MKILFFGDIVGQPGRLALKKNLPELKKELEPDLVVANGENIAHGQGLTRKSIEEALEAGVDWLTGGDHVFVLKEGADILGEKKLPVLRPLNWPGDVPGRGYKIITVGSQQIMFVSLIGRVFMKQDFDDPFRKMDELFEEFSLKGKEQGTQALDGIIVDFHAEATSEKAALAWHLDGKISALLGTHTHVPTADEKILPQGTAFISDVGMVGVKDSILGVQKEIVIRRFLTQRMLKFEVAEGSVEVNSVLLTLDGKSGLAQNIVRVRKMVYPE
jgi:metallophosphoesterase (TIGR00282 family)